MEIPAILLEAFDGDDELLAWYGALRSSWHRYIGGWIMEPKSEEARKRRADQIAERFLQVMEAERELPPLLARRLRGTRYAMAGWERMTFAQRRECLMRVFSTRNPETQERHVAKMVEACVAKGAG